MTCKMMKEINREELETAARQIYVARPQGYYEGGSVYVFFDRVSGAVWSRTVGKENSLLLNGSERSDARVRRENLGYSLRETDYMIVTPKTHTTIKGAREQIADEYYNGNEDEALEERNQNYCEDKYKDE